MFLSNGTPFEEVMYAFWPYLEEEKLGICRTEFLPNSVSAKFSSTRFPIRGQETFICYEFSITPRLRFEKVK
jgi:hypothetical protein